MHPRQFRLLEIHQKIDDTLRRELLRRWPDPLLVLRLKKMKLRVKDRLYGIARAASSPRAFSRRGVA